VIADAVKITGKMMNGSSRFRRTENQEMRYADVVQSLSSWTGLRAW